MSTPFEFIATLQYRLKAANAELAAFKSEEVYMKIQNEHSKVVRFLRRKIKQLEQDLSSARAETIRIRNQWFEVFEDMEKEFNRKLDISKRFNKALEQRALKAERQLDEALDKVKQQRQEFYTLATELEEEKGRALKLQAQNNRDYENSSIPSSKSIKAKKIDLCNRKNRKVLSNG